MEETQKMKPVLKVLKKGSNAVDNARIAILVFAWLSLIVGAITALCGIEDASSYLYPDSTTLVIGISLAVSCIPQFILASIVRGFVVVVETAELKKELIRAEYKVEEVESE